MFRGIGSVSQNALCGGNGRGLGVAANFFSVVAELLAEGWGFVCFGCGVGSQVAVAEENCGAGNSVSSSWVAGFARSLRKKA